VPRNSKFISLAPRLSIPEFSDKVVVVVTVVVVETVVSFDSIEVVTVVVVEEPCELFVSETKICSGAEVDVQEIVGEAVLFDTTLWDGAKLVDSSVMCGHLLLSMTNIFRSESFGELSKYRKSSSSCSEHMAQVLQVEEQCPGITFV